MLSLALSMNSKCVFNWYFACEKNTSNKQYVYNIFV